MSKNTKEFTIKQLLEAGVHFGHKTMRWNPKMTPYIYGVHNNLHIINLQKTAPMLAGAMKVVEDIAKKNGRILFVGTKKQASETIAEEAERCGQFYVNHKWLGGMLTNWNTISKSLKKLRKIEKELDDEELKLSKKERLVLDRQRAKLEKNLGGIRNMGRYPDLIIVVDTNRESLAIKEAKALDISIMAVVDTNSDPDGIDFLIPGNDDSIKAIRLYFRLLSDSILEGIKKSVEGAEIKTVEVKKTQGKKVSTKKSKSVSAKKEEKLPVKKEEVKTPAEMKTKKVPAETKKKKVPAVKQRVEVPAVGKKSKVPEVKKEPKTVAKTKVEKKVVKKVVDEGEKAVAKKTTTETSKKTTAKKVATAKRVTKKTETASKKKKAK